MNPSDSNDAAELCPNCGTAMVIEGGQSYCPKCSAEIDWGMGEGADD